MITIMTLANAYTRCHQATRVVIVVTAKQKTQVGELPIPVRGPRDASFIANFCSVVTSSHRHGTKSWRMTLQKTNDVF
jgi:hypothetical protein